MTDKKLETLIAWFKENEIYWDKDAIEIRAVDNGFGIFAIRHCAEHETLAKIPKTCILSPKNSGAANIFDDEEIEGGCALAIAVMYELTQGTDSPWFGYLQALPSSEDLPIFWTETEKEMFKGSEMEEYVHREMKELQDDYIEVVLPLVEKYPTVFEKEEFTLEKFCRISTLVSSRAFEIDAYHEMAMVPFADIFNHRSGNEDVHFQSTFEVCEACGALDYCEHRYLEYMEHGDGDGDEDEEWSDVDEDEEHEEATEDAEDNEDEVDEEEGPLEDLEELEAKKVDFWKDEDDEDEKDTCDLVLERDVEKGAEIFNTYGPLPNVALLSKYGFCHDKNENDYISTTQDTVFSVCVETTRGLLFGGNDMSDKATEEAFERVRSRFEFFYSNEDILCGSDDEDDEDVDEDEDEHGGCCDDDHGHGHGHGHSHDHGHEHEHGHGDKEEEEQEHEHDGCCDDDGCCGGEGEDEMPQPYYCNAEGEWEDNVMCLLHVVFAGDKLFEKFEQDVSAAVEYFHALANESDPEEAKKLKKIAPELNLSKKLVYLACRSLTEIRRHRYLDANGRWVPVEEDITKRDQVTNKREYYALTCRISEKQIIQRSIKYYESRIKACNAESIASSKKKGKGRK